MGNKIFIGMAIILIILGGAGLSYNGDVLNFLWFGIGCFTLYSSTKDYLLEDKDGK